LGTGKIYMLNTKKRLAYLQTFLVYGGA